jgi:hypothetical protein
LWRLPPRRLCCLVPIWHNTCTTQLIITHEIILWQTSNVFLLENNHTKSWFAKSSAGSHVMCSATSRVLHLGEQVQWPVCVRTYVRPCLGCRDPRSQQDKRHRRSLATSIHLLSRRGPGATWTCRGATRICRKRCCLGSPRHALSLAPSHMVCGLEPAPSPLRKTPPLKLRLFTICSSVSCRRSTVLVSCYDQISFTFLYV